MEKKNPLMESYLDVIEAEFWHDTELMYNKWKEKLGVNFNGSMRMLCGTIEDLRRDCKPGTTFVEAGLLMISCNLEEESTEDNKKLNELTKAAIQWKLKQDHATLSQGLSPQ